jgi:transformation/transcription domain-associated protein
VLILIDIEQTYTVEWKRKAFFKFVDVFRDQGWAKDLKAKV